MLQRLKNLLLITLLTTLFAPGISFAAESKKVYSWLDENGVLVFSDNPKKGAKQIDIKSGAIRMPSVDTSILQQLDEPTPKNPKQSIAVTLPEDQDTIYDNNGSVYITSLVSPSFAANHKIQLKLDGKPINKPQSSGLFVLRNIDRGEHKIVLELHNGKGKVIATSKAVTFYMFRASAIKPARAGG